LVPGVSLSVTCVFGGKLAEQVVGQLIPAGLLVTVPVPAPAMVTVIASLGAVFGLRPTQPTSTRLDRTDKGVKQNVYRNFIGELLLQSPRLDEREYKMVVCCHERT
jgi:ABC-type transport system involved in cytochrome c biogenesis permease subunit